MTAPAPPPAASAEARRLIEAHQGACIAYGGYLCAINTADMYARHEALTAYVAKLEAEMARRVWRHIDADTPRDRPALLTDGTNSGQGFWHDGSERHPSKGGAGWFDEEDRGNLLTAREWHGVIGWMELPDPQMPATLAQAVPEHTP